MQLYNVFLTSTGCYIVQTETNHVAAYLESNGYNLVDRLEDADSIIVTTCAVTESASESTHKKIQECVKKRNDNVPIYVLGCYSRIEKKTAKNLSEYDNIISIPEIKDIENLFLGSNQWNSTTYNNFFSYPFRDRQQQLVEDALSTKWKFLKTCFSFIDSVSKKETLFHFLFANGHLYNPYVQRALWPVICSKGCTHACTYCAVRIGRGKYTSKPLPSILSEIRTGIKKGHKRILLIGDELGPYGVDLKDGTSLAKLLNSLLSDEYPASIGLWYLDAFELLEVLPALIQLADAGKIFFLGITIQHGSERILKLMNRKYSITDIMAAIRALRKYAEIIIATQFMVGFPTETEKDFLESYALVETGCFDKVEVFQYSPRPGTKAAKMLDDVPPGLKSDRATRLGKLAAKKSKRLFLKRFMMQFSKNTHLSQFRGTFIKDEIEF
jgi:tRNA A37 methylthiotransferase MiaB